MKLACRISTALCALLLASCAGRRLTGPQLAALVATPPEYCWGWSYWGSSETTHYLAANDMGMHLFGSDIEKYQVSRRDFPIPRTYAVGSSPVERIFVYGIGSLPYYVLSEQGHRAVLTAKMSDGKSKWTHEYSVASNGRCTPDGAWLLYDTNGRLIERTEYHNGKVSGTHWIKLDWDQGASALISCWRDRIPEKVWTTDPDDATHVEIHFDHGKETLKEQYGSSCGKKLLLRRWENGREVFKGSWVKGASPPIADRGSYLAKALLPDFDPSATDIATLRSLANTPENKKVRAASLHWKPKKIVLPVFEKAR